MTLRRLLTIAAALLVASVVIVVPARADSGSWSDPGANGGPLEIKSLSHTDSETAITYRIEFYKPVRLTDIWTLLWEFDFNGDGTPGEACIRFSRLGGSQILRGVLSANCGPEVWATTDARFTGDNTIEMTLQLIDLVECCGLRSGTYGYRLTTTDHKAQGDHAPDQGLVLHKGIRAPAPRSSSQQTQDGGGGQTARRGDGVGAGIGGFIDKAVGGVSGAFSFAARGLCAGPSCMSLGFGVPVVAIVVGWLVVQAIRRRRAGAARDPRSQPGNIPFAQSSPPGDSVPSMRDDGTG